MKQSLIFGVAMTAALSLPTLAAESGGRVSYVQRHRHVDHGVHRAVGKNSIASTATAQVAAPAPILWVPHIAPYPNGKGDTDGLSRNVDDCNKGCIGGNPG